MENRGRVVCPENEALEDYVWTKWQSMAKSPKPMSENSEKAVQKAYLNVCGSKTPILTLKEFSNVKGAGKWILKLMQGFFADDQAAAAADTDLAPKEGREMVRILLAAGANPIAQDAQHRTALHTADVANDEELVQAQAQIRATFYPKFENEKSDQEIRLRMIEMVSKGLATMEVSLKHSGSLFMYAGHSGGAYAKNSFGNIYTAVGVFVLGRVFKEAWGLEANRKQSEFNGFLEVLLLFKH